MLTPVISPVDLLDMVRRKGRFAGFSEQRALVRGIVDARMKCVQGGGQLLCALEQTRVVRRVAQPVIAERE